VTIDWDKKGPAVKFPPPLIFVIAMLCSFALQQRLPIGLGLPMPLRLAGLALLLVGTVLLVLASFGFARARTAIEPWKPTTAIVTSGVYAWSRNPIYVAFCLITSGIGLASVNVWMVFSTVPAALLVYSLAIKKEEQYLQQKFGDEYLQYQRRVRRWL
jgi:protein-S-isoprenylcysteine O-methyltransferase Ste14